MIFSCPVVRGFTIISNLQTIVINHIFPERSIPVHLVPWVPSYAMCIEVSREDSATLPNDSLPVELLRRSLFRMSLLLVVNVDDPGYPLPSAPDVGYNDIFIRTSA